MAAPALEDSWFTRANVLFADVSTAALINKSNIFNLKAHLCDQLSSGDTDGTRHANSVWSCVGSSDGATAGLDASDRWGAVFDASKIVQAAAGVAHSWIALHCAAAGVYCVIDCVHATTTTIAVNFSYSAPSGGSTTAAPTMAGSWSMGSNTAGTPVVFAADNTLSAVFKSHFSINDTGEFHYWCTRDTTGIPHNFLALRKAVDTTTGDTRTHWCLFAQGVTGRGAPVGLATTAAACSGRTTDNSAQASGGLLSMTFGGQTFAGSAADHLKSKFNVLPLLIYTFNTSLVAARGRIPDLWFIGGAVNLSSYPDDSSPTQIVLGDVLAPCGVVIT